MTEREEVGTLKKKRTIGFRPAIAIEIVTVTETVNASGRETGTAIEIGIVTGTVIATVIGIGTGATKGIGTVSAIESTETGVMSKTETLEIETAASLATMTTIAAVVTDLWIEIEAGTPGVGIRVGSY